MGAAALNYLRVSLRYPKKQLCAERQRRIHSGEAHLQRPEEEEAAELGV